MNKEIKHNTEITFTENISPKNRRDFIKVMSVLLAGTVLPVSVVSGMVAKELSEADVKDYFSLNKINPTVNSLIPGEIKHVVGTSFSARYSMLTLGYDLARKEGAVDFNWTNKKAEKVCETIVEREAFRTRLKGYYYQKSKHKADQLNTLVKWNWKTKIALDFKAEPFQFTETEGKGNIKGDHIEVWRGNKSSIKKLENLPLLKWSHWPLVMEMKDDENLQFDWIDEKEQVFYKHRIMYRGEALVTTQNGKLKMRAFQQTGTGKIPTVYWVYNNVILMVMSGTEVYVLDEFNGKEIRYELPTGKIKRK